MLQEVIGNNDKSNIIILYVVKFSDKEPRLKLHYFNNLTM